MPILNGLSISTLGMRAQATALHVIGTNVSNVQTGGFKRTDVEFQTLISEKLFQQSDINGTRPKILQRNSIQGHLQITNRLLDLAIVGDGFFVTQSTLDGNGQLLYNRDGSFETRVVNEITVTDRQTGDTFQSSDSYLADKNGNFLLGYPVSADGTFPTTGEPVPMRVDRNAFIDLGAVTTSAELQANLDSNAAIVGDHLTAVSRLDVGGTRAEGMELLAISFIDSNGTRQTARLNFTKADTNEWDVSATYNGNGTAQIDEIELSGDPTDVGDVYSITVNGTSVSYTAVSGDTLTDVVSGLVAAVNADPSVSAAVTATAGADNGTLRLTATAVNTPVTTTASTTNGPDGAQLETITIGSVAAGERYNVIIDRTTVSYTATAVDTAATVAASLVSAINATGTVNTIVTAAAGAAPGTLTLTGDTAGDVVGITSTRDTAQVDTVTIAGTVEAGDIYNVAVNGNNVSYVTTGLEANLAEIRDAIVSAINSDATVMGLVTAAAGTAAGEILLTSDNAGTAHITTSRAVNGGATADNIIGQSTTIANATAQTTGIDNTTTTAAFTASANAASVTTIVEAEAINTTTGLTRLTFTGDGLILSPDTVSFDFSIPASATLPAATATFDMDVSNLHQFANGFLFQGYSENGFEASSLNEVTFDSRGRVVGFFDNGRSRELYQVPLAKFANPDALETKNGQVFLETTESGTATIETIDLSEIATFATSVREVSNVDLVDEFTTLIKTQQAYNSSANAFRTMDEMYQAATQMKR